MISSNTVYTLFSRFNEEKYPAGTVPSLRGFYVSGKRCFWALEENEQLPDGFLNNARCTWRVPLQVEAVCSKICGDDKDGAQDDTTAMA